MWEMRERERDSFSVLRLEVDSRKTKLFNFHRSLKFIESGIAVFRWCVMVSNCYLIIGTFVVNEWINQSSSIITNLVRARVRARMAKIAIQTRLATPLLTFSRLGHAKYAHDFYPCTRYMRAKTDRNFMPREHVFGVVLCVLYYFR